MTAVAVPVQRRDKVGWGDLLWLTWRQHRWMVGTVAVVLGVGAVVCLVLAAVIDATGTTEIFGKIGVFGLAQLAALVPLGVGAVVAVFWAAPLVSREYELKTSVVVWSQDLTPARWVLGKIVLLGVPAIGLAAGFGAAVRQLMAVMNQLRPLDYRPFRPFEPLTFEAAPLVQVGYAAFGFALGLALSALTRRTLVAMALTLGGYIVARGLVLALWRPYYQTPLREVWPYKINGSRPGFASNDNRMYVDSGYLDAAGNEVPFPTVCARTARNGDDFQQCMADHGIVNNFSDYQPVDRVVAFQVTEFFVFAVPAVALLVFAYYWVKRSHRI
ncbi:ABC transporter permease [Saccharothrix variisporea]|uniref:ABC-2 family transporter n=1 Tax=Saccharothrix variisporea TaxID=543527 RepID=A0A495XIQ6_9PSEU|nr:hypothetical protein [Saccharothrix variisporea]RKT72383.1 hypothetical protein DFJ66_5694 [Saccharothrix variisporea]